MDYQPFNVSNDVLDDVESLQARLAEDGYLFIRNYAPQDDLLALRKEILQLCADEGWVKPDTDLMDGVWGGVGPYTEGEQEFMKVYRHVVHLPAFKAMPEHTAFMQLMGKILGEENVLMHRRRIGRITFPQNVVQTITSHQDYYYIRGTPETYTMWMPLSDCPTELGSLMVLRGSHKAGFIDHQRFPEKNVAFGLSDDQLPTEDGIEWHGGDFALGDVLLFHSYTIHRALPNMTTDRFRLSIDNRYQHKDAAIEPGSMGTHYDL